MMFGLVSKYFLFNFSLMMFSLVIFDNPFPSQTR